MSTLIHSCQFEKQLPALGQYSIGRMGQLSIGADRGISLQQFPASTSFAQKLLTTDVLGTILSCVAQKLTMNHSQTPKLPSERSFGALFSAVFIALGAYCFVKGWSPNVWIGWLVASALVAVFTIFSPRLLIPFNKAWQKLGELLGKIVNPIVLGFMFFGLLTPIALIARLAGRDELRLKRQSKTSYWIERSPPGVEPESFKNQF